MGRAIDMEKDIQSLKLKFEQLDSSVRGMMHELEGMSDELYEMSEKSTKTKKVDLVDDVKEVKKDVKKKANRKRNGKSNKSSDKADGDDNSKSK